MSRCFSRYSRNGHSVRYMALHAHAERVDPLQEEKGIERRDARSQIAKTFDAGPDDESDRSEYVAEDHAVVGRRGLIEQREVAGLPVELSAIDNDAADAVPWPPMNLVRRSTTMSAPKSIGRQR